MARRSASVACKVSEGVCEARANIALLAYPAWNTCTRRHGVHTRGAQREGERESKNGRYVCVRACVRACVCVCVCVCTRFSVVIIIIT